MLYLEAFSKVLPVLLLFILGAFLRKTHFLAESTVGDIKKLIVNITLPSVLFLAFAGVSLEVRHLVIVAVVFIACLLALLLGRLIGPPLGLRSPYFPALMTGFEAGMMGYAIFAAAYGGGEDFQLRGRRPGAGDVRLFHPGAVRAAAVDRRDLVRADAAQLPQDAGDHRDLPGDRRQSAGRAGAAAWMAGLDTVLRTVELLGGLTTPLIGLVIGYEVRLQRGNLLKPAQAIALRLLLWAPAGLLLNALVVGPLFPGDRLLQAAVMTMFVLPPPFVIPLFMPEPEGADRTFVVNTLSLATLVTLVAFTVVTVLYRV